MQPDYKGHTMNTYVQVITSYVAEIDKIYRAGNATEHSYRPALKTLFENLTKGLTITNEPKHIDCGAPDYIITRSGIPLGYIEAKDISVGLDNKLNKEQFDRYRQSLNNLIITDYLHGDNPDEKINELYNFYSRYGDYVLNSLKRIQNKFEDLSKNIPHNSLLEIIAKREHLKTPLLIRVNEIDDKLRITIPLLFRDVRPNGERDFNNKIQALFIHDDPLMREYPPLKFGITEYRPDHLKDELLIESKYIRGKNTPSKITDGIAADITKAQDALGLLFIVYDPDRSIVQDEDFINSLQGKRDNCYVRIYR
jgi:hypothetical protein